MEIIYPAEISGKIMTLIDQAKKSVVIVSPYNKFDNWKKFKNRIKKAHKRGVKITWYIRSNVVGNREQIEYLGITPIEVDNLHCKMYINENQAVVTSMNLYEYSDHSSIDIGYLIEDHYKLQELFKFIDNYIKPYTNNPTIKQDDATPFIELLEKYISTNYTHTYIEIVQGRTKFPIKSIILGGFSQNFILIFEPKPSYFRIDLQINLKYTERVQTYNYLKTIQGILEKNIGIAISYGNQMKRLKIDLNIFDSYQYDEWSSKEFELIKDYIDNIIIGYYKVLTTHNYLPFIL